MSKVKLAVRLFTVFAIICLASNAQATTIIKLDLGGAGPDIGMNSAGQLSTIDDGDASTVGDQDTNVVFTGALWCSGQYQRGTPSVVYLEWPDGHRIRPDVRNACNPKFCRRPIQPFRSVEQLTLIWSFDYECIDRRDWAASNRALSHNKTLRPAATGGLAGVAPFAGNLARYG